MRMHQYPQARKAFYDALKIRPGLQLALDNLAELQRFDGIAYNPGTLPLASGPAPCCPLFTFLPATLTLLRRAV
jgi:hypothetical protein